MGNAQFGGEPVGSEGGKQPLHHYQTLDGSSVGMLNLRLEEPLLEYLLQTEIFQCASEKLETVGFARCVDYPNVPGHVYYEGYFHSCQRNAPICCVNPRTGLTFDKPPAPKRLRAFYRALRQRNLASLAALALRLREATGEEEIAREAGEACGWTLGADGKGGNDEKNGSAREKKDGEIESTATNSATAANAESTKPQSPPKRAGAAMFFDPAGPIPESFLGDLAIQIHCGDGIGGKNIGFHYDHVNSLFHLALSVHGTRALHYYLKAPLRLLQLQEEKEKEKEKGEIGRNAGEESAKRAMEKNPDRGAARDDLQPKRRELRRLAQAEEACRQHLWFRPGDVYATSPALFKHGVEYPHCAYENRVIAVQARFLLTDRLERVLARATMNHSEKIYEIIADFLMPKELRPSPFSLPTLAEVLACEAELEEYDGPFVTFEPETDRFY